MKWPLQRVPKSPTRMTIPYAMSWEKPARARAEGYDHDHEILVALPPSYHVSPERSYPVLWSMDGAMAFAVTSGIVNLYTVGKRIPEIIVVGVGHRSETGMLGFANRTFDLFPPGSVWSDPGLARDHMKGKGFDFDMALPFMKGDLFLDFLVDQLRPSLGEKYRMADDHALWGHSAGRRVRELRAAGPPGRLRPLHHRERDQRPDDQSGGRVRKGPRRPGGQGLHRNGRRRAQPHRALRPAAG